MNTENNQSAQVEDQTNALFEKFYNTDLTPEQVDKPVEETVPAATAAAPTETTNTAESAPPAEETKAPEVAAATPPSTSPDPNEWLASLSADARSKVEQLFKQNQELAQQSQALHDKWQGQVSKNRKLNNDVLSLQKKVTQNPVTDVRTQEEVDEDWKRLEEADPVLAKILKKREEQIIARTRQEAEEKAQQYIAPIQQEREEQYVAYQQDVLTQSVPNWRDVVRDPHFKNWIENSSNGVKAMYGSLDAQDSIRVLQLYAADVYTHFGAPPQAEAPQAQQQQTPAPSPVASKVAQQRQEKLARSAPLPAQPAGQARQAPLTEEQLFAKLYENPEAILELISKQRS